MPDILLTLYNYLRSMEYKRGVTVNYYDSLKMIVIHAPVAEMHVSQGNGYIRISMYTSWKKASSTAATHKDVNVSDPDLIEIVTSSYRLATSD